MTTPIVDFVRQYAQSGTARLHMPGHKGQSLLGCEPWDITEIRGADELYEAEGIIAQSEANATRLFGTAHTYYSTEGSSVHPAMLCLALQGAPAPASAGAAGGPQCPQGPALCGGLLDFDIRWLWPAPEDSGALCSCPVTVQALSAALEELAGQGRTPFGVYLTSRIIWAGCRTSRPSLPSAMLTACPCWWIRPRRLSALFAAELPPHRAGCGHVLRLCPQDPAGGHRRRVSASGARCPCAGRSGCAGGAGAVRLYQPSYLILQSLDACNAVLAGDYPRRLVQCCAALEGLRRS